MFESFIRYIVTRRKHDFAIGGEENPYCLRWWVIPRNRVFNIYLHKFVRDDADVLHDHPWVNCSISLHAGYIEEKFKWRWRDGWALPLTERFARPVGSVTFRLAHTPHRIILRRDANGNPIPGWSLFLTGPVIRGWGFVCPGGRWVPWKVFTSFDETGDSSRVGRGCGE
jgi:hypothetical protein